MIFIAVGAAFMAGAVIGAVAIGVLSAASKAEGHVEHLRAQR